MMGVVLVIGTAVVITNILIDILYVRVDPRIRIGRAR
jgi:ABC-type dipeptide/oligopeptide/nickel transport system permease component